MLKASCSDPCLENTALCWPSADTAHAFLSCRHSCVWLPHTQIWCRPSPRPAAVVLGIVWWGTKNNSSQKKPSVARASASALVWWFLSAHNIHCSVVRRSRSGYLLMFQKSLGFSHSYPSWRETDSLTDTQKGPPKVMSRGRHTCCNSRTHLWIGKRCRAVHLRLMSLVSPPGLRLCEPDLWPPPRLRGIFPQLGELQQGLYGSCLVCADSPCSHLWERSFRTWLRGAGGCCGDGLGPTPKFSQPLTPTDQHSLVTEAKSKFWKGDFSPIWPQTLDTVLLFTASSLNKGRVVWCYTLDHGKTRGFIMFISGRAALSDAQQSEKSLIATP